MRSPPLADVPEPSAGERCRCARRALVDLPEPAPSSAADALAPLVRSLLGGQFPFGSSSGTAAASARPMGSGPSTSARSTPFGASSGHPASSASPAPTSPATSSSRVTWSPILAQPAARRAARPARRAARRARRRHRRLSGRRHRASAAGAARGGPCRRAPALPTARRPRRHASLRRRQRLLSACARAEHDVLVRPFCRSGDESGAGPGVQARADLPQAGIGRRPSPADCWTSAAAGAPWRCTPPRTYDASVVGITLSHEQATLRSTAGRRGRARRSRRDPRAGLPGPEGRAFRRHLVDRHVRARRQGPHGRVLRDAARPARAGREAAEPRHLRAGRVEARAVELLRSLRVPRRRAARCRRCGARDGTCRVRVPRRRVAPRALRHDAAHVGGEPRSQLGRGGIERSGRLVPGSGGCTWPGR